MKVLSLRGLCQFVFNGCLFIAMPVMASSSGVVISQIYGGNGSVYTRDYVELFNASNSPVDISGWSLQYSSATGTGLFSANGITVLNGTLQAGQYYLVALASAASGAALPAADANGTSNLSGTNGKVILAKTNSGLACNGGSTPCTSAQQAQIEDLLGYGTSNYSESAAAPVLSATTALVRAENGCNDSNNNANDFSIAAPSPRNSASPLSICGGGSVNQPIVLSCPATFSVTAGSPSTVSLSARDADGQVNHAFISSAAVTGISTNGFVSATSNGDTATLNLNTSNQLAIGSYPVTVRFENNQAQNASCVVTVEVSAPAALVPIYEIQANGLVSPLNGSQVTTEGLVTAVFAGLNGFYLQDETGDANSQTSDGIFVYMGAAPNVTVGQKIRLKGTVTEFNTVTQLTSVSNIEILGTNHAVLPLEITLPEAVEGELEAYEGMLVRIVSPMTVSQNYFQGRYGQVSLSANGRMTKPTNIYRPNSLEAIHLADENARRRITLDDGSTAQNPNPIPFIGLDNTLRAGDIVSNLTGVIDYGLITASSTGPRDYKLHPTITPDFSRENPRTASPSPVGGNIKAASFNVLNYFTTFTNGQTANGQTGQGCSLGSSISAANCRGADNQAEFTRQRDKIINAITAINADVLGLMEIQNNGAVAVQNLVDGLNAKMGANTYTRVIDPTTGTGTDAIKVAMIYKPSKLSLLGSALSDNNSINNRPTLAQTFIAANGEKFSLVVNHFKSKSCSGATGTDVDQNDGQGCYNATRVSQALQLIDFIGHVKALAQDDDVLVIGDLNSYGKEDPIDTLAINGFADQISRFNGLEGYSYVFDGESGYLDHALANTAMVSQITGALEWHINADEPFVIDYNTEFKPQDLYTSAPYKASDHDPVVIGLNLQKQLNGSSGRDIITGTAGDDIINGGALADTITTGAGKDTLVYENTRDATDTITDFSPGHDRIDLHTLLVNIGYSGSNPFLDGYISLSNASGKLLVQLDTDGSGAAKARPLLILNAVSDADIDIARDFTW